MTISDKGYAQDGNAANASRHDPALSARQIEVLILLSQGLQNKQIGHRLGISDATVKAHIAKAKSASGSQNRLGLALFWLRRTGRLQS